MKATIVWDHMRWMIIVVANFFPKNRVSYEILVTLFGP